MQNQWFISIMSRSYSFNLVLVIFFEKYKKAPKSAPKAASLNEPSF